jgi:hypothetical protein
MAECPRCSAMTTDELSYCAACGRPRIVESLRASRQPPTWLRPVQEAALVLFSAWLLVTVGVAFLREYKAVRDGRRLLAVNQVKETEAAWMLLGPFVEDHPRHEQGQFLGGKAAIRLEKVPQAKQCLLRLSEVSPELAKQLGDDYRQNLAGRARGLACNEGSFLGLLAASRDLGGTIPAAVIANSDGFVEACASDRDYAALARVSEDLGNRGQGSELVHGGYLPAIGRALGQGHYSAAKALAGIAVHSAPEARGEVRALLDAERAKVEATKTTLADLCRKVANDPRFHPGAAWCFPSAAPADLQGARDGWGNPIGWVPNGAAYQGCHGAIALTSYGAAGSATSGEWGTPGQGILCQVSWGIESWQLPEGYWQPSAGPDAEAQQVPVSAKSRAASSPWRRKPAPQRLGAGRRGRSIFGRNP